MPKFTLHFRQTDFPLVLSEFILDPKAYGQFDYRFLQEKDTIAAFLTEKGIKQMYKFGRRLLNDKFSKKIINRL
jgi:hypothetical protein